MAVACKLYVVTSEEGDKILLVDTHNIIKIATTESKNLIFTPPKVTI